MSDPDERLRRFLGAEPPEGVRTLGGTERASLADLLEAARTRQATSLDESFTATLKHVPFPVRKIVKKVLLG